MLEVANLRSAYGRIEVLKGVSLDVQAGEIVALVGSNGAGKTTLLRTLSGVQPATGGEIRFNGQRIDRLPSHLRVELGITQSPEGRQVFGPLTVEDNLRLGAYRRRDKAIEQDRDRIFNMFPVLAEKRHLLAGGLLAPNFRLETCDQRALRVAIAVRGLFAPLQGLAQRCKFALRFGEF